MTQEILDLNRLTQERTLARIDTDGTLCELADPEDFSAVQLARLGRLFTEHDRLWEAEERNSAEDQRLESLLDEVTQMLIPDAPADAIKALPALSKRGLAVRFFVSAGLASQATMGSLESLLANSSPGSPASTEDTPASG